MAAKRLDASGGAAFASGRSPLPASLLSAAVPPPPPPGADGVLVIDVGRRYTKVGMAGESTPRCIVRTALADGADVFLSADYESKEAEQRLYAFFKELFYRRLALIVSNRRVVLLESVLAPSAQRRLLAAVLFGRMQVASVLFVPAHMAAPMPYRAKSALVLDVGDGESLALPVLEQVAVLSGWQSSAVGGASLRRLVERLMRRHGRYLDGDGAEKPIGERRFGRADGIQPADGENDSDEHVWEEALVRCCFVAPQSIGRPLQEPLSAFVLGEQLSDEWLADLPPVRACRVWIAGTRFYVPAFVRAAVCETLFMSGTESDRSIVQLILDAVLHCPIDARRPLLQRLVLAGGCALLPGLYARLRAELLCALRDGGDYARRLPVLRDGGDTMEMDAVRFYRCPGGDSVEQWLAWMGGSLFGATEATPLRSLAADAWIADGGRLPDWTDAVDSALPADNRAEA